MSMSPLRKVDLRAVKRSQSDDASRKIALYILENLPKTVRNLPSTPERVFSFVMAEGRNAYDAGYDKGRVFPFYILSQFLLGCAWWDDPVYQSVLNVWTDQGLDGDARLDLAFYHVTEERKRLERATPNLIDAFLSYLALPVAEREKTSCMPILKKLVFLRGFEQDKDIERIISYYLELCRNAFDQLNAIQPKETVFDPSAWAKKHMYGNQANGPLTTEKRLSHQAMVAQLFLAMCFGRNGHVNQALPPLIGKARREVYQPDDPIYPADLIGFLKSHLLTLKSNAQSVISVED